MNKEAIEKEIARLNKKIEIEVDEIKREAQNILRCADTNIAEMLGFSRKSQVIANCENAIREYIASRTAFEEILKTL